MRKVFSILVSLVLLASGMQVSLDKHYCGGQLADIKLSVTGKMASCGMKESGSRCPVDHTLNNRCCEDKISFYTYSAKYFGQYHKISNPSSGKDFVATSLENIIPGYKCNPGKINLTLPPGSNQATTLTRSQICILQI